MSWFSSSKEDGMKDEGKGKSDPIREVFDKDYKKGVDISKAIKDGEKAHREFDKYPISEPVVDAFLGPLDTLGKSKDYEGVYNRVKYGESPGKVFSDELSRDSNGTSSETDSEENYDDHNDTPYDSEDRHFTMRDSDPIQSRGMSKLAKWAVGLGIVGLLVYGINIYNNPQNKKPEQKSLISKRYAHIKTLDEKIAEERNRIKMERNKGPFGRPYEVPEFWALSLGGDKQKKAPYSKQADPNVRTKSIKKQYSEE